MKAAGGEEDSQVVESDSSMLCSPSILHPNDATDSQGETGQVQSVGPGLLGSQGRLGD